MQRIDRMVCRVLLAITLMVTFAACDGSGRDARDTFEFAYQNRVGSAPCIVADRLGFFREEGLNVRTMQFNSGPACSEALFSGSARAATMGDATAVIAVTRHDGLRVVGSHAEGEHRHRLVGRPGATYDTPRDLVGKTLAVKKGTSTYGGLLAFLAANRIDPAELRVVNLRPAEMPDALMAGSIDCFVASEPTPSLAETKGALPWETMGGLGNNYPIMIVAHAEVLEQRPEDVRKLLRALQRGVEFMREHPERTRALIASATGLPQEAVAPAMERHRYRVGLDKTTVDSLQKTADFLTEQQVLPRAVQVEDACVRGFLPDSRSPAPRTNP